MEVYVFKEGQLGPEVLYECNTFLKAEAWVDNQPGLDWSDIRYRYHNCEPFRLYRSNVKNQVEVLPLG